MKENNSIKKKDSSMNSPRQKAQYGWTRMVRFELLNVGNRVIRLQEAAGWRVTSGGFDYLVF